MLSGGLLSRQAKLAVREKKKRTSGTKRENTKTHFADLPSKGMLLNWSEARETLKINNPNTNPTYAVEVKGRIRFKSAATALSIVGFILLLVGSLVTGIYDAPASGPVGVGFGIYSFGLGICWLLDDRDRSAKLYHIQDLYSKYAAKKHERFDKAVQVDMSDSDRSSSYSSVDIVVHRAMDSSSADCSDSLSISNPCQIREDSLIRHQLDWDSTESDLTEHETPKFTFEHERPTRTAPNLLRRHSMLELTHDIKFPERPLRKETAC